MEPRINNLLEKVGKNSTVSYVGRNISASTATGYGKQHAAELRSILDGAFSI